MSQSVDTKIVELKFNNDNFKDKVNDTLNRLELLNESLKKVGSGDSFKNLSKSAKDVDLSGIDTGVKTATKSFSKLEVAGITALANLTNSAVNFGKKMVSNVVNPIIQGGLKRAKNIELATFQFQGLQVIDGYEHVMNAVKGTAYAYDEAAKAASQFAASGKGVEEVEKKLASGSIIKAQKMTQQMENTLLGVAGVAAMTGSTFEDISQIFTKVAGQGRVMGDDLNRIATRGLNATAVLAKALNTTEEEIKEKVRKGEITFDQFADAMYTAYGTHAKEANDMFDGAVSNMKAALARIGADFFTPALEYGRELANSLTPLIDVIHNVLQPALEKSGNLMERVSQYARNGLDFLSYNIELNRKGSKMGDWAKSHLESYLNLMDVYNKDTKAVYDAIDGWTKYSTSVENVTEEIQSFQMIADYLGIEVEEVTEKVNKGEIGFYTFYKAFKKLNSEDPNFLSHSNILETFQTYVYWCATAAGRTEEFEHHVALFKSILSGAISIFKDLKIMVGGLARIAMSILERLAPLAPLVKDLISDLARATVKVADFMATSKTFNSIVDSAIDLVTKFFDLLKVNTWPTKVLDGIGKAFEFIAKVVTKVDEGLSKVVEAFKNFFINIATGFQNLISDSEQLTQLMESLKGAAIVLTATKMALALTRPAEILETFRNSVKNVSITLETMLTTVRDVFNNISGSLGAIKTFISELTNVLKRMQTVLVASALLEIAIAIAVLAGSFYLLSTIDYTNASGIIGALGAFIGIVGSLLIFLKKLNSLKSSIKVWEKSSDDISSIATGFVKIAVSLFIIAGALKLLSTIESNMLWQSLAVVEVIMFSMAAIAKWISGEQSTGIKAWWSGKATSMVRGLRNLIYMAVALKIVAKALVSIANEADPNQLKVATAVIEVLMWSMAAISKWLSTGNTGRMAKGMMGLIAMALALRMLVKPINELVADYSMDPEATSNAFGAILTLLIAMGGLSIVMAKVKDKGSAIKGSLAMIAMAKALQMIAKAIEPLLDVPWEKLAQTMGIMIGAIYALAGAMKVMDWFFTKNTTKTKGGIFGAINKKLFGEEANTKTTSSFKTGELIAIAGSFLAMAEAVKILGEACVLVGEHIDVAGKALGVLGGALLGIIIAAASMKNIPIASIGKLALLLLELIGAIAGFGIAMGIFGIGVAIFGASLKTLAEGCKVIAEVADVLVILLGVLALVTSAIVLVPELLLAFAGLGIAVNIFAAGMYKLGTSFESIATAISVLVGFKDEIGGVSDAIHKMIKDLVFHTKDVSSLSQSFEALATPLQTLSEVFGAINKKLTSIKENFVDLLSTIGSSMSKIAFATDVLSNLKENALDKAVIAIMAFIEGLSKIETDATPIAGAIASIRAELEKLKVLADEIVKAFFGFKESVHDSLKSVAGDLQMIANPLQTMISFKDSVDSIKEAIERFITSIANLKDKSDDMYSVSSNLTAATTEMKTPLEDLNTLLSQFDWAVGERLVQIGNGMQRLASGVSSLIRSKDSLPDMQEKFSNFINSLYNAMTKFTDFGDQAASITDAIADLANAAKAAIKNLDTSSMVSGGEAIAKAMASGINSTTSKEKVKNAIDNLVLYASKSVDSTANKASFKTAGSNLTQGLIDGLNSKKEQLKTAANNLATTAASAVKAAAQEHSPSKVWMRIGAYMGEGLAIGIKNSGTSVIEASENLATSSEYAVKSAIQAISSAIDDDLNLDPVIRPVVDLSDIDRSARALSSKFGGVGVGATLANSIGSSVQNGSLATNASINRLSKALNSMTESMNSRTLNVYNSIEGSSDPTAFANDLVAAFRLNARTV